MINVESIPAIRRGLLKIQSETKVLREVAERLIEKSAWWYDHPQGKVRAPKHCERIATGQDGLELVFGANKFLVGKAIKECASQVDSLLEAFAQTEVSEAQSDPFEIKKCLRIVVKPIIRRCVEHENGEKYAYYGTAKDDFMRFGTQAISVNEFVDEFLMICELRAIWTE